MFIKSILFFIFFVYFSNVEANQEVFERNISFTNEYKIFQSIEVENKKYTVWALKDKLSEKKTERKIISFVRSDPNQIENDKPKKLEEYSIIYYKEGNIEYQKVNLNNNSRIVIDKNVSNLWYSERVYHWDIEGKFMYGKWLRKKDKVWMYGIYDEKLQKWALYKYSNQKKIYSETNLSDKDKKEFYQITLNLIKPANQIFNYTVKLEKKLRDTLINKEIYVTDDQQAAELSPSILEEKRKIEEEKRKIKEEKKKLEEEKKKVASRLIEENNEKLYPFSSGSGFLISSNKLISNNHVIDQCDLVNIVFKGKKFKATVLAFDKVNDLTILEIDINSKTFYPVSNEDVTLLEDVIIAGFPLGNQVSSSIKISKGSVSSLAGYANNYSNFQTDAAINQGNSGGPILNQFGNVVGVAVSKWVEEGVESFNFGVKSSTLKTFVNSNNVKLVDPHTKEKSNKELGKLIQEATLFIECNMSLKKIKEFVKNSKENRKAIYEDFK